LETIELKAKPRVLKGNGPARALRREGSLPAVLYGPNTAPLMLSIKARDIDLILKNGGLSRSVYNLVVEGDASPKSVMIRELQTNPVSRELLHADLYEVSMDRKIKVNVPVVTTGKSVGVELGGMLQIIRRELEVFCLPNAIPQNITIDVTDLNVGDSIHVEDIQAGEGIEIPHDVNFTILTISTTKREAAEGEGEEGEESEAEESAAEATESE
jgi:large subunit ribosomal protein L25